MINVEKLKTLMYWRGVTQRKLAKELKIDKMTTNQKVNGKRDFKRCEIVRTAEVLDMSGRQVLEVFFPELVEDMPGDSGMVEKLIRNFREAEKENPSGNAPDSTETEGLAAEIEAYFKGGEVSEEGTEAVQECQRNVPL